MFVMGNESENVRFICLRGRLQRGPPHQPGGVPSAQSLSVLLASLDQYMDAIQFTDC